MRAVVVALLRKDWISRACIWFALLLVPEVAGAATYTVTNSLDIGGGSLRQAIHQANTNPGPDVIQFNIPAGTLVIHPLIELPAITDPVRIDGATQPGYAGRPLIEINGDLITFAYGLRIESSNSIVTGLAITHFAGDGAVGLLIAGPDAAGNWVYGNRIGLDARGSNAAPNFNGIVIDSGAHHNLIGGSNAGAGNVIAFNQTGIQIVGTNTFDVAVLGNSFFAMPVSASTSGATASRRTMPGIPTTARTICRIIPRSSVSRRSRAARLSMAR